MTEPAFPSHRIKLQTAASFAMADQIKLGRSDIVVEVQKHRIVVRQALPHEVDENLRRLKSSERTEE